MLADLLRLISRSPAAEYDRGFIKDVKVVGPSARSPRVEKFILACWVLIAIKHVFIIYAVHRWAVPFHQLWVNFPTWLLGLVATVAYYLRG